MIAMLFLHGAMALWEFSYATTARTVNPIEQHVHSFLEMIPLKATASTISLHWNQFIAPFELGQEPERLDLAWKKHASPLTYIVTSTAVIVLFEILPYLEELVRGILRE